MSDLERRLREGRPPVAEPAPGTEERLRRAAIGATSRERRSPEGWRRVVPRSRGGRLLSLAVLVLAAAAAAALAAGVLDRDASRTLASGAAPRADWSAPVTLAADIDEFPRPRIAMDVRGDAMVAWTGAGVATAAYRPHAGRWTSPVRLSRPGVRAGETALAVARDGLSAIAAWRERRGTRLERRVLRFPDGSVAGSINRRVGGAYVLVARRWRPDAGWSAPVRVSGPAHNRRDIAIPQAVALERGFLLAWTRNDTLEARVWSAGGALGPVERIVPVGEGDPGEPRLASDGPDALLVWANRGAPPDPAAAPAGAYSVQAAERRSGGWTPARRIAAGLFNNPYPTAALRDGAAVVAWTDLSRPGRSRVAVSRRGRAGGWEEPALISSPTRAAFAPGVAIDGTGRIVAQWSVGATTQVASAGAAGAWSRPAGSGDAGLVGEFSRPVPSLVADGAGRLVGVFGGRGKVTARNWPAGGPFGRPVRAFAQSGWQYGVSGLAAAPNGSAALAVVGFGSTGGQGTWSVMVAVREPAQQRRDEAGR